MVVTRKIERGTIDGTPEKRLFWSIISDYNIGTSLCELIDNAIDLWALSQGKAPPRIELGLDVVKQAICVTDNAGGIKREDLRLLLSPGGSRNDPNDEIIGIFGVGSKRAVVALGERVEIRTRKRREATFQIDITKEWMETADWEMAVYEVPDIPEGRTEVRITQLREQLTEEDVTSIETHLGETYATFIDRGCMLVLNDTLVQRRLFDAWAFPPGFRPRSATFQVANGRDGVVRVRATAGLILDRDAERNNYGVYFYCNGRLIAKELRTRDVGYFISGEAGVPHPDASLCRVVVELDGPAKLMPWNSSKSGINPTHPLFRAIRPTIIQLTSYFSSLSRRLKSDWINEVFRYRNGEAESITVSNPSIRNPLELPALPRVNKTHVEEVAAKNRKQVAKQPWTLGLVESMAAVDIVVRQKLETKNRIALVLLDSTFEIALKEFIVHRSDIFSPKIYNDAKIQQIFSRRHEVIREVKPHVAIPEVVWQKAQHYYSIRNKLVHERATVSVTDSDIANYKESVSQVLSKLFQLKF